MAFVGLKQVIFHPKDLNSARNFLSDFGLRKSKENKKHVIFTTQIGSEIVVQKTPNENAFADGIPENSFKEMIWGVSSKKHLAEIQKELEKDREVFRDGDGVLHTTDPNHIQVGFSVWKPPSRIIASPQKFNQLGNYNRRDQRSKIYRSARPLRMGHIGFFVANLKAAEKFYGHRLGFPVSDRYGRGTATFFRCKPREDHHNLFLLWAGDGVTRFHHIAFEVNDIHEVFGGGLNLTRNKGWKTRVGPGRHPVSSAYFWYFKLPFGGAFEYFSDSDFATEHWRPTTFYENRFSEWHMLDGIPVPEGDGQVGAYRQKAAN